MNVQKPDVLHPALIGGLIGGFLAVAPPFCCLNCCCCLNYILAGAIAGAIYAGRAKALNWFAQAGEGASVGVLAGAAAGALHGIAGAALLPLLSLSEIRTHSWRRYMGPNVGDWPMFWNPPAAMEGLSALAIAFAHLVLNVFLGAVVGALGGMIGVVLFRGVPSAPASWRAPGGSPPPAPPADLPEADPRI